MMYEVDLCLYYGDYCVYTTVMCMPCVCMAGRKLTFYFHDC